MPATPVRIVVPCYNEAARFDCAAFSAALSHDISFDLIFVDDGSTDSTRGVLESFARSAGGRARVLALPRNAGKAEAVRVGMRAAFEERPTFAGYWDADLAAPFDALADFLAVFDRRPEVDIIVGSRVRLLGHDIRRRAMRHYLGRVFATAASLKLGLPVYDTQCGAKMFRVTPRTAGLFDRPFASRWVFDVELIARYLEGVSEDEREAAAQRRIYELALRQWHHQPGSKIGVISSLRALLDLARIPRTRRSTE